MIKASIAAFLASYFSVFHAPRMDLFWCSFLPIIIFLILVHKQSLRAIYIAVFFYIWTQAAVQWQLDSRYHLPQKATLTMDVEITSLPQIKSNSISFIAKPLKVYDANVLFDFLKLNAIKINWYRSKQLPKGGQVWRMTLRLQAPHGYQNEGGFDYERWMFAEGISATAYVLVKNKPKLISEAPASILKARSWLSHKIQAVALGLDNLALFQTLSIGDKSLLDPKLKQLFIDTGSAHLLVISGLHIGLLSLLFYFLASWLWFVINGYFKSYLNQRDFAVIWAWSAAFVYAALAGFSLPTLRALIMLSVVYIALLRRQNNQFLNTLATALICVLLLQPLALLSYSFWLSFLAILLIVLSQYGLLQCPKWKAIIYLQLLFSFLFIPLNAVVFQQFVGVSFFANLVLIPIMSFIVIPLNLMATALASTDWFATVYLYQFLDSIIAYLVAYLKFLNEHLSGVIALSKKSAWLMILSAMGALLLVFFPKRNIRLVAGIIMLMPWFYWPKALKPDEFSMVFFDVGMGTSVFIKTQHHGLIYDLGPGNQAGYQPAKWVLEPYFQAKGIEHIDTAIVSHSDQDHYGGIWALADHSLMSDTRFLTGTLSKLQKIVPNDLLFKDCHSAKPWVWDGVVFSFLPLISKTLRSDNNQSCVLSISSSTGSALLTGDVEVKREAELVQHYQQFLKADVMLVPHHGSRTSSSIAFLKAIAPNYAVVTTGYLNHWGFPKQDVMQRYNALAISWFNTGLDGEILFEFKNNGIAVKGLRKDNKALWY